MSLLQAETLPAPAVRPRLPSTLRFVDMFCGIGGFHAALSSLGAKCVFACDIDEEAQRAYEANYGLRPEGDISAVDAEAVPDHDILCAGFPCQPFSIIGDRGGFADARGTLFFEIARILDEKHPPAFILENVRQLTTHDGGATLKRILEVLEGLGYEVEHQVLDARNFTLPQKRERVLIVGTLASLGAEFRWPKGQPSKMKPLEKILEKEVPERFFASKHIRARRRRAHRTNLRPAIWHENKGGNISSHPYSCALRAGASYNYLLVDGERRLTPREMLRLQGFRDSFKIVCNDSQTRRQAGNAVPVPVVRAVARELKRALLAAQG